jgi:hypothetical protein
MSNMIAGLSKRYHVDGSYIWYIDKRVKRYVRLCESTGTADCKEAERYLLHRLHELREVLVYGERPTRTFTEAAEKYVVENRVKRSIGRVAGTLKDMEPFIGHLPLNRIKSDTFACYRSARRNLSVRTRNQKIALAGRILQLAATVWCFPGTNLTWLASTPEILMERGHRAR